MFNKRILGIVLLLLLVCWADRGESQSVSSPSIPTKITSDTMMVRNQDLQAIFKKNVVLTKGTLTVRSDEMVVFYKDKQNGPSLNQQSTGSATSGGASKVNIERIIATGRVKIKRDNGNATCQQAVYHLDGQKIVLTGNPIAWQAGNRVKGKKIIMFLDEDRTIVEGGSQVIINSAEGEAQ